MTSTAATTGERDLNRPEQFRHVVAASRKRLFAVFDNPQDGLAAVTGLPQADLIPGEEVWLLHGEEGLRRLDPDATHHRLYGRFVRLVQVAFTHDHEYIDALARALRAGALVAAIPVRDIDTADRFARILEAQSGHTFAYTTHMDFVPTRGEVM